MAKPESSEDRWCLELECMPHSDEAMQWVDAWYQSMGTGSSHDQPIMQWVPLLKEIRVRAVPVVVDLSRSELDQFRAAMDPRVLFLWVATESEEEELALLRKVERWTASHVGETG